MNSPDPSAETSTEPLECAVGQGVASEFLTSARSNHRSVTRGEWDEVEDGAASSHIFGKHDNCVSAALGASFGFDFSHFVL